jgi:hypothetical protein
VKLELGRHDADAPKVVQSVKDKRAKKESRKIRTKLKAQAQEGRRAQYARDNHPDPMGIRANYTRSGE